MRSTRRGFVMGSGAALVAAACRQAQAPAVISSPQRSVTATLAGMPTTDGAGVSLTRVIGQPRLRNLDPFIMLDRFHSDQPDAYLRGFPDHPHRGFETVTVMLAGRMRHRDSRGNSGLIAGQGAQWMTAARGIIHSEMPEQERGLMSGYQLWVNLPAAQKMGAQGYQDLAPAQLASGRLAGATEVRVIAGEVQGLVGPVRERPTAPLLLTAALNDDRPVEFEVPAGHTAFVFVGAGEVQIGPEGAGQAVNEGHLAVLGEGRRVRLRAVNRRSELLLAAGKPLREPIVQRGPFVMNSEEEIRRAFEDYRNGVLDKG